ncbi:MAG: hypothetical protein H0X24_14960 [Ktedonobacterales bacterium]|nr:hypothetical protein [Ktedonobacterales bacterium]
MQVTEVTVHDFRDWLTTFAPTAVVGQARLLSTCPVATFLTQQVVPASATVSVDGHTLNVYTNAMSALPEFMYDLAEWVLGFVEAVDRLNPGVPTLVTAARALMVLDDVLYGVDGDTALPLVVPGSV